MILPRPSSAARVFEVSESLLGSLSFQSEDSALRVHTLYDPAAAWQFKWAVEDLAAASLHAPRRRIQVADVEIIEPKGNRDRRGLGLDPADGLFGGREQLIRAYISGLGILLLPPKKLDIET